MKLRKLLDFPEPLGDFMAFVPGSRKQQNFPSTVSYVARLILHRYAMLGMLDENGAPRQQMGILESPVSREAPLLAGAKCPECGNKALIRRDGCDYCTACGYVGICG
jgi:ribonucleoside-diphosphate reductase alpha chain